MQDAIVRCIDEAGGKVLESVLNQFILRHWEAPKSMSLSDEDVEETVRLCYETDPRLKVCEAIVFTLIVVV